MEIDPAATLVAGTSEAVMSSRIACDLSTPMSVEGTITQPGISGGFTVEGEFCTGGDDLLVIIPARDFSEQTTDYVLGPAEATITAVPFASLDAGPGTTPPRRSSCSTSPPSKAVFTRFLPMRPTPGCRARVLEAIRVRIRTDPVFRQIWIDAISGASSP